MSGCYAIVHLLVNEVDRSKAVIKYETKLLEVRLKRITEAWDRCAAQYAADQKPPVMWLDAVFQSAVKSWRVNAVKQDIATCKRALSQTTTIRIERLFNLIASQQELVFFDKSTEDD